MIPIFEYIPVILAKNLFSETPSPKGECREQYSMSRCDVDDDVIGQKRFVLHNVSCVFHMWSLFENIVCITWILKMLENGFYIRLLTFFHTELKSNLSVPGRCPPWATEFDNIHFCIERQQPSEQSQFRNFTYFSARRRHECVTHNLCNYLPPTKYCLRGTRPFLTKVHCIEKHTNKSHGWKHYHLDIAGDNQVCDMSHISKQRDLSKKYSSNIIELHQCYQCKLNSTFLIYRLLNSRVNTLRPAQNGRLFPDDIFKYIFPNKNV